MVAGSLFPSCSPSAAASLAVKPPVPCRARHRQAEGEQDEAKKKAVKTPRYPLTPWLTGAMLALPEGRH